MALQIGVVSDTTLLTISPTCPLDPLSSTQGFDISFTCLVCQIIHTNCTFIQYSNTTYGDADENGTGTGMIGLVQQRIVDTSLPIFQPTFSRLRAVRFSDTYYTADRVLATRAPALHKSSVINLGTVTAFHWSVWLSFFSCLFLIIALIKYHSPRHYQPLFSLTLFYYLITTDIGHRLTGVTQFRLLFVLWSLGTVIVTSAYTGVLFSQKLTSTPEPPFTDLESFIHCLDQQRCAWISYTKSVSHIQFFFSEGSPFAERLKRIEKKNPIRIIPKEKMSLAMLEESKIYLVRVADMDAFLASVPSDRICDYYILHTPTLNWNTFAVSKNSTGLLRKLNSAVNIIQDRGLHVPLHRKYFPSFYKYDQYCVNGRVDSWYENGDMLHAMATSFLFLISSLSLASAVFMVEIFWYRFSKRL